LTLALTLEAAPGSWQLALTLGDESL